MTDATRDLQHAGTSFRRRHKKRNRGVCPFYRPSIQNKCTMIPPVCIAHPSYNDIHQDGKGSWTSKIRKRVQFSQTLQVCPTIALNQYSSSEKASCWWTKEESRRRQRSIVVLIKKELPTPITASSACMIEILRTMQETTQHTVACGDDSKTMEDFPRCFAFWTSKANRLRGLEKSVTQVASTRLLWDSYQRKADAAEARSVVVRMQASLTNAHDEIASVYRMQSRVAATFAHYVGLADEQYSKSI
jgi:hypothetical protein